jgi:hypothetical protein
MTESDPRGGQTSITRAGDDGTSWIGRRPILLPDPWNELLGDEERERLGAEEVAVACLLAVHKNGHGSRDLELVDQVVQDGRCRHRTLATIAFAVENDE